MDSPSHVVGMPILMLMTCKKVRTLNRRAREMVERNEKAEVRDISTQALASYKCNG